MLYRNTSAFLNSMSQQPVTTSCHNSLSEVAGTAYATKYVSSDDAQRGKIRRVEV